MSEIDHDDFDDLYMTSNMYKLSTIIFPIVDRLSKNSNISNDTLMSWNKTIIYVSTKNFAATQQIKYLLNALKEEDITPVVIKGIGISRLYKNPEYRNMGDLDILVEDYEWEKTKEIVTKLGYIQCDEDDYNPLHVEFKKKGAISIEVHRNLIHTHYLGERQKDEWYDHIRTNKKKVLFSDIEFYAMCEEDELINQVVHFAAHFVYVGTSLKHLFEMALIIKTFEDQLDWKYIENTLKTMGFFEFGKLLFSVCNTYFYVNVPSQFSNLNKGIQKGFMKDLLNYYSFEGTGGDYNGWIHLLGTYRNSLKKPILRPFAWIIEIRNQYKLHGLKIGFLVVNSIRNIRAMNRKIKIIKKFGLWE